MTEIHKDKVTAEERRMAKGVDTIREFLQKNKLKKGDASARNNRNT